MWVYKALNPGLVCLGVQLKSGMNIEPEANCKRNGWHAAEDPLDCLTYYHDEKNSELWVCDAGGDIDEDGVDSKVSCTHLRLIKRLTLEEFVIHAIAYMLRHPERRKREAFHHGSIHIVCGPTPKASGKAGDVLGLLQERDGRRGVAVFTVDGSTYLEDVEYTIREEVICRA